MLLPLGEELERFGEGKWRWKWMWKWIQLTTFAPNACHELLVEAPPDGRDDRFV